MKHFLRNIRLVSATLLIEAWRRREIYAIVLVTTILIVALRFVHFFNLTDVAKFYREICLKAMNVTTAATVILLAARQLPREFSNRTIYPILAKPITRVEFLIGKYVGVLLAGIFCYALFMVLFLAASLSLHRPVGNVLFLQSIYLQILSIAVLAALVFLLSTLLNADAAITISAILYLASQVLMNLMSFLYDYVGHIGRIAIIALHYIIPQLTLFDASAKVIHSISNGTVIWPPLPLFVMAQLTAYAAVYILLYFAGAYFLFRRKPL